MISNVLLLLLGCARDVYAHRSTGPYQRTHMVVLHFQNKASQLKKERKNLKQQLSTMKVRENKFKCARERVCVCVCVYSGGINCTNYH